MESYNVFDFFVVEKRGRIKCYFSTKNPLFKKSYGDQARAMRWMREKYPLQFFPHFLETFLFTVKILLTRTLTVKYCLVMLLRSF